MGLDISKIKSKPNIFKQHIQPIINKAKHHISLASKNPKILLTFFVILTMFIITMTCVIYASKFGWCISSNKSDWIEFATYFSGILSPILTILGFVWLIYQIRDNSKTVKQDRLIQKTSDYFNEITVYSQIKCNIGVSGVMFQNYTKTSIKWAFASDEDISTIYLTRDGSIDESFTVCVTHLLLLFPLIINCLKKTDRENEDQYIILSCYALATVMFDNIDNKCLTYFYHQLDTPEEIETYRNIIIDSYNYFHTR